MSTFEALVLKQLASAFGGDKKALTEAIQTGIQLDKQNDTEEVSKLTPLDEDVTIAILKDYLARINGPGHPGNGAGDASNEESE